MRPVSENPRQPKPGERVDAVRQFLLKNQNGDTTVLEHLYYVTAVGMSRSAFLERAVRRGGDITSQVAADGTVVLRPVE